MHSICIQSMLFADEPPYDTHCRHLSKEALSLLQGLLQKNPRTRLSASEALEQPWFSTQLPKDVPLDDTVCSNLRNYTKHSGKAWMEKGCALNATTICTHTLLHIPSMSTHTCIPFCLLTHAHVCLHTFVCCLGLKAALINLMTHQLNFNGSQIKVCNRLCCMKVTACSVPLALFNAETK